MFIVLYFAGIRKKSLERRYTFQNAVNLIVRIAYPVLLVIMTALNIVFYLKRRQSQKRSVTVSARFKRQERSLFLLMIVVILLAIVQVVPRETKRIIDLLYPDQYVMSIMTNQSAPIDYRLAMADVHLYGGKFLSLINNICTAIDRSFIVFLYFLLNPMFRRATVQFLCCACLRNQRFAGTKLHRKYLSMEGENDSEAEERKQLMLLISPQLSENFNKVFSMSHQLMQSIININMRRLTDNDPELETPLNQKPTPSQSKTASVDDGKYETYFDEN